MHIVLGGTGHIGRAAAAALLERGEPVTVTTRDRSHAQKLEEKDAKVAEIDLHETEALRKLFQTGRRAYLVNPPADPSTDTDREEHRTIDAITTALDRSGLDFIVVASTYGSQPGELIGDLGTLNTFEEKAKAAGIPCAVLRAAYYMSNWDMMLEQAKTEGKISTFFPADFKLPMVAPDDIGSAAADLLLAGTPGLFFVEGPAEYSADDVAKAFAKELDRSVEAVAIPQGRWEETYRSLGFSEKAARSYTGMTTIALGGGFTKPTDPIRGRITLDAYIHRLVAGSQ